MFLKREGKDEFRHAGSLEAADDELAVVLARETYVRRAEGDQLWLVDRSHVVTVEPEFLTPNADKPHRHNDGHLVADRRRAQRTVITPAAREVLLAFADDEHLMGQQHAEWIGVAPFLEEDLAFCSIAQDELGHAATLYELLADDGDVDALAFGRPPAEYRSCHLVEVPCPDWADALARHWLYDLAEELRWEALAGSSVHAVADAVERAQREETYHRRHAEALVRRMLDDPDAGPRVSDAIRRLLPLADALVGARRRRGRARSPPASSPPGRRRCARSGGHEWSRSPARSTGRRSITRTSRAAPAGASPSPPSTPASTRSSPSTPPPAGRVDRSQSAPETGTGDSRVSATCSTTSGAARSSWPSSPR